MAPSNFGAYSGDLLVGNFGNGRISAYQLRSTDNKWVYKGQVRVANGKPIAIDGLWANRASGTAPLPARRTTCTSSPDRPARHTACSASSPSAEPLARSESAGAARALASGGGTQLAAEPQIPRGTGGFE